MIDLELNGQPITVEWLGEGGLRQARELLADRKERPDVAAARRMSPGARKDTVGCRDRLGGRDRRGGDCAGVPDCFQEWACHQGAAEAASLVHLPSSPSRRHCSAAGAPPSALCRETTGLSAGSATYALRTLTDLGLISADNASWAQLRTPNSRSGPTVGRIRGCGRLDDARDLSHCRRDVA